MSKTILTIILITLSICAKASNPDVKDSLIFRYDKNAVNSAFTELNEMEKAFAENDTTKLSEQLSSSNIINHTSPTPFSINEVASPGKIPSFLWSFVLSAVGTYFIYTAALGPISVIVVYFASKRNKKEVRRALWGWILGTITGIVVWLLIKSI